MIDYKPIAESNNFIILDKYNREWMVAESYQSENDLERELIAAQAAWPAGCHWP
jgi:type I restriction enzyme R subunit